jgi:hypothetical protein
MATIFDLRAPRGPGARSGNALLRDALARPGAASLPGLGRGQPAGSARVMVVFVDHVDCPWLRLLRRGFRHCFVVFHVAPLWLACEALKDRIELHALDLPPAFDLARFYADQGHRVLLGRRPASAPRRRAALAPLTCVTVAKRLLGIHAPWVWSPWQLYAHLRGPMWDFRPWWDGDAVPGPAAACAATDPMRLRA